MNETHESDVKESLNEEKKPEWILQSAENEKYAPIRALYFIGDTWISSCGSFVKNCSQEMCHLGYQLMNGACAFAIGLLEEPGYSAERRQRIQKTKASVTIQDIQKEIKENPSSYSYKNYFPRESIDTTMPIKKLKSSRSIRSHSIKANTPYSLSNIVPQSPFNSNFSLHTPFGDLTNSKDKQSSPNMSEENDTQIHDSTTNVNSTETTNKNQEIELLEPIQSSSSQSLSKDEEISNVSTESNKTKQTTYKINEIQSLFTDQSTDSSSLLHSPTSIHLKPKTHYSFLNHKRLSQVSLRQFLINLILFIKRYFLIFLNYVIEWIRLFVRTILCFITFFLPTGSFVLKRKNEDQNEAIHLSFNPGQIELSAEDIPGLVEDMQMKCYQIIDDLTLTTRKIWSYACNPYNYIAAYKSFELWIQSPTKLQDLKTKLHVPTASSILKGYLFDLDAYTAPTIQDVNRKEKTNSNESKSLTRGLLGFPLEEYTVHTIDGYCIVLFRIPNRDTKKIVYLQHGVMDTAFAWISNTSNDSLATVCYEQGYDVFFGSFRGTDGHYKSDRTKHETLLPDDNEYWRFTIDDLVLDWEAFIHAILVIKERERINPESIEELTSGTKYCGDIYVSEYKELRQSVLQKQQYNITAIGHSMGGMTLEQYIMNSRIANHPHFISKAILLSPAGYHYSVPLYLKSLLYVFDHFIPKDKTPSPFPVNNSITHLLVAKVLQDLQRTPATLEILNFIASSLIGGQASEWPFQRVNYTKYPLGVCSFHIILDGLDLILHDKYTMFDFGETGNLQRYHKHRPIDYADCFKLIDVPMHYLSGKYDTLVPPKDVERHVHLIQEEHPELATMKVFETAGHLQFTIGLGHDAIDYIVQLLNEETPVVPFTFTETDLTIGYTKCNPEGVPYK